MAEKKNKTENKA